VIGVPVDEKTTANLIKRVRRMAETSVGGERVIAITELLAMLYFPIKIAKKINAARGDMILTFKNGVYGRFMNRGIIISEDLPGADKYLGIKLKLEVSGDIEVYKEKVVLKNLNGIAIVWPFGIENELDEVVITPKKVYIDL